MMHARTALLGFGGAIALTIGGGTAYATIAGGPVINGVVQGCYDSGGNLKVLLAGQTSCEKGYTALTWTQTGPAGATGPAGPQGPAGATGSVGATGPAGVQGPAGTGATVSPLATGDPNCASGGASITDGNNNVTYACNGAAGTTGPPGPAGQQGQQGPAGATGPQGPAGPAGSSDMDGGQVFYSSTGLAGFGGYPAGVAPCPRSARMPLPWARKPTRSSAAR